MTSVMRARWKTISEESLVFMNETLELTLLSGDCVKLVDVEFTETFDVDGSTVL